jgi:ligand-binding SRPBCC domain-containing protein
LIVQGALALADCKSRAQRIGLIFGTVGYMSSENAARELHLKKYLARYSESRMQYRLRQRESLEYPGFAWNYSAETLSADLSGEYLEKLMSELFVRRSRIEASAEELFRWHAEPGALERLTPSWEPLEVVERAPSIQNGARGILRVRVGPFPVRWVFEHRDYEEGRQFRDVQVEGPFRRWDHTHRFIPDGPRACWLEDRIEYELPLGIIGEFFGGWLVRRKLERMFEYCHRVAAEAMAAKRA